MKAKEFIFERDSLWDKVKDVSGWSKYQNTDQPTADDDWNPFRSKGTKQSAVSKPVKKTAIKPQISGKNIKDFEIKDVVSRLQNGQAMYADDQDRLNRLISGLKKGSITSSVDTGSLLRTLKDAQQGKNLSDEQKQILVNYKNNL
jgi:hypothetical protein